ncbi:MAG: GGDEF domain-containing protein [Lachnospiraceae bacterium]|nr:GGDEF domain-containing protein [Lachnospiraceae bacterium]
MNNDKPTIALLVTGLDDSYTEALCRGVNLECVKKDYNLLILPGSYIEREISEDSETPFGYQYNTIFSYVNESNISGLIVAAGSIGAYTGKKDMEDFLAQFQEVPKVLVSSTYEGYQCVNYDNEAGVRDGLEYLYETCRVRKFGMLRGPSGNTDCEERYNAFMKFMISHGLEVTEENIGNVTLSDDNHKACRNFLTLNPDVEAVFCVNDYSALDLCDEIKAIGKTVGEDIKVFGYDNTIQGAKATPPLASVAADPVLIGRQAVVSLKNRMSGRKIESVYLPARLVIRDSMGSAAGMITSSDGKRLFVDMSVSEAFNLIFYRYRGTGIVVEDTVVYKLFSEVVSSIISIRELDSVYDDYCLNIENSFEELMTSGATIYADIENLVMYLEQLQISILKDIDLQDQVMVQSMFQNMFKMVLRAVDTGYVENTDAQKETNRNMKIFVKETSNVHKGNDYSYSVMLSYLDWVNVKNAYLYVFDNPIKHMFGEEFAPYDQLKLKVFRQKGSIWRVPRSSQQIEIYDLYKNVLMDTERSSMVVLPLFSDDYVYGFMICDLTDEIYSQSDFIVHQLSNVARVINSLKVNEQMTNILEERNNKLKDQSKQDVLTNILNRRGFNEMAGQLLNANKKSEKNTLVAYVDLNNLKVINDKFGHDAGDKALKVVAEVMQEKIPNPGVIGRIGGDEFAFAVTYDKDDDGLDLERILKQEFAMRNLSSDRPYNITVSIGKMYAKWNVDWSLEECMVEADTKLYVAKQYKPRKVVKEMLAPNSL